MPKQAQSEARFLNQQVNSLLKPVIITYTTLLSLHKHGEHDDTSTQGAQQQG